MGLLPLLAIQRHYADLTDLFLQKGTQEYNPLLWRDTVQATRSELRVVTTPSSKTHLRPGTPVDAQCWSPLTLATMREQVKKGICGNIVALSRRTKQRGRRRKEHKEIKGEISGEPVEIRGTYDFRAQDTP